MIKRFLLLFLLICLTTATWAGYGILVNGTNYYDGTFNDTPMDPTYTEYAVLAVPLHTNDYLQLYDNQYAAAWVVDLDKFSTDKIVKKNNQYLCSQDGCYDFYIKLKYGDDQLYVGDAKCDETTYYLAGNGSKGSDWCCGLSWDAKGCPLQDNMMQYHLPAGDYEFKITDGSWDNSWGAEALSSSSSSAVGSSSDGNVRLQLYDADEVTISFISHKITINLLHGNAKPIYQSSVPSQCADVMLQGFYWDSYHVSGNARGTELYGDTRWITLLQKAGDIGAYFDLVWLPPSAYSDGGAGYHPIQYSNQNSCWGNSTELHWLLRTLHGERSRIIADMVVNHIQSMNGWCDLAVEDFGSYGKFEPDMSWICQDDEVNKNPGAGDCYGTATGPTESAPYSGGEENYAHARDWAHNLEEVREMCRAYAKWLNSEIGYDGLRYDYCKGFHASHFDDYNRAGEAYISVLELWSGNSEMQQAIKDANYNTMVLDFQSKYSVFDELGKWGNYIGRGHGLMADDNWKKYAVTWIDNHDNFLRNNGGEFGGEDGKSMDAGLKYDRLMQANALMLSMPGIPCVFYPHWQKYGSEIKQMINARRVAGVHSESEVKDESWDVEGTWNKGYQATIVGKNGFIVLQLGTKATTIGWDQSLRLMSSGNGWSMWVKADQPVPPAIAFVPTSRINSNTTDLTIMVNAEGGTMQNPVIYYTLDGSEPTSNSASLSPGSKVLVKCKKTIKAIVGEGGVYSEVYSFENDFNEHYTPTDIKQTTHRAVTNKVCTDGVVYIQTPDTRYRLTGQQ